MTTPITSQAKPFSLWPHNITVGMMPEPGTRGVSGIHTVIEAYNRVFPEYGMTIVPMGAAHDVSVVHAGMTGKPADVSMLHGVYFTADYRASNSEWRANEHITKSVRGSMFVTVPSDWVGETIRRDLRLRPIVVPHGVFYDEWQGSTVLRRPKTVFWGKNRVYQDVCDPTPLSAVASLMPDYTFLVTIAPENAPPNVVAIGLTPHAEMRDVLASCTVVLSTVKETWGILYAESMACGTPVCTVDKGNVPHLVPHGVAGYTYNSRSTEDMAKGIEWCDKNWEILGQNARKLARKMTWHTGVSRIRLLCEAAIVKKRQEMDLYARSMATLERGPWRT